MKLKEIATISGKPGLYRIFKPTKGGVIVESLDDKKTKMAVGTAHRVSILKEVSIYTTTKDGSVALEEVLHQIRQKYPDGIQLDAKASGGDLSTFLAEIVPDFDREKVYASDMKKLVSWYNILQKYSPETFDTLLKEEEASPEANVEEAKEEVKVEASGKKKSTKKAKETTETQENPKVEVTEEAVETEKKDSAKKAKSTAEKEPKKTSKKKAE